MIPPSLPARWRPAALALAAVLPALIPQPAGAHEFWLAPSAGRAGAGDTVTVGALVGEGFAGLPQAFAPGRVARFIVRAGRELDLTPVARAGDTTWARFVAADPGGILFAYESSFTSLTLEGAAFDRYLAEEGLDAARESRRVRGDAGPGRERYRRCARAWVAGDDTARATRPVGLPFEIVPLAGPESTGPLSVRVLFEGRPLPGVLLRAWRQPADLAGPAPDPPRRTAVPPAWSGRTNAAGEVTVPAGAPGEWLLSAVHMIPSRDPAAADWESAWASLTWTRPARR